MIILYPESFQRYSIQRNLCVSVCLYLRLSLHPNPYPYPWLYCLYCDLHLCIYTCHSIIYRLLLSFFLNILAILSHQEVKNRFDRFNVCLLCNCLSTHIFFFFKFLYFRLHWVFIAACGLSLVAASGGYSLLLCVGFSLRWLLLLWSMSSRCVGFSSCGTWAQ